MVEQSFLFHSIIDRLDQLAIPYRLLQHEAVYTMPDVENLHIDEGTRSVKNLFLRDSTKRNFYLVSLDAKKKLDTKMLKAILHSTNLSFASEALLFQKLQLTSGAVSPLAIIGDPTQQITLILDDDFTENEILSFHPGSNTYSVFLRFRDLLCYLKSFSNPLMRVKL